MDTQITDLKNKKWNLKKEIVTIENKINELENEQENYDDYGSDIFDDIGLTDDERSLGREFWNDILWIWKNYSYMPQWNKRINEIHRNQKAFSWPIYIQ